MPNATKFACIAKLKTLIENNTSFNKTFFKIWHASGGIVNATCPHGVIYCSKWLLKAESARDVVDILFSIIHPPNIIISDMAPMVAAHGNKRWKSFFNPYNGRAHPPTEENIKAAKENLLDPISLPWINTDGVPEAIGVDGNIHPVSAVSRRYSFFDRLHESNCKKDVELLRRVRCVAELSDLNTETAEQLNKVIRADTYFLDSLSPNHFLQLSRSIFAIKNSRLNQRFLNTANNTFNSRLLVNELGMCTIDVQSHTSVSPTDVPEGTSNNTKRDESLNNNYTLYGHSTEVIANYDISELTENKFWKGKLTGTDILLWNRVLSGDASEDLPPVGAPFSLLREDMKTLGFTQHGEGDYIRGELIDCAYLIFAGAAISKSLRIFILPVHFLTSCQWDVTQELLLPEDFRGFHVVVGAMALGNHWYTYAIDARNKRLYFLDSLANKFTADVEEKVQILKNIVWTRFIVKELPAHSDEVNIETYDWTIITTSNYEVITKKKLPHQTHGSDCGVFAILYNWHIIFGRNMTFTVNDMPLIRQRLAMMFLHYADNEHVVDASCNVKYNLWNMSLFKDNALTVKVTQVPVDNVVSEDLEADDLALKILHDIHSDTAKAVLSYRQDMSLYVGVAEPRLLVILQKPGDHNDIIERLKRLTRDYISDDDQEDVFFYLGFECDDVEVIANFINEMRDVLKLGIFVVMRKNYIKTTESGDDDDMEL